MSVVTTIREDGSLVIAVDGRFDFSTHREFRHAYASMASLSMPVIVDLSRADYLDSSALGMLLLLRQHAGGDAARVTLSRPRPAVRRILSIANFQRLFRIE